jgi:hypothetical protein
MQDHVGLHQHDKAHFSAESFIACQGAYSDYLLGEVRDQLAFYYSGADFDELIGFFKFLRGSIRFNWSHFEGAYLEYMQALGKKDPTLGPLKDGAEQLLQFLYDLNIVGYDERSPSQDEVFVHWCFRDRSSVSLKPKVVAGLEYDSSRPAYFVHAGLARALGVGNARRRK